MMAGGTKRAADDSTSTASPRGSKAQKTEKSLDSKNTGKRAAKKTQPPLSTTEFKSKALPLHVNLTHTPPSILERVESDILVTGGSELEDVAKVDSAIELRDDIGFIENLTLLPSSFTTGSYGWKGSKRITVELQDGDGEGEGGKEKVQVMLSINATVIGSKPGGKRGKGRETKKAEEDLAEEPEADENDDVDE